MGALIMTHSDDHGLVLPPNLAPNQVVIVPIYKSEEQFEAISKLVNVIVGELRSNGVSVKYDDRDTLRPGAKFAQHELQGVPLRIAIGPRDVENGTVELARRDTLSKEVIAIDNLTTKVVELMGEIQNSLYEKALNYRDSHITEVNDYDTFKKTLEEKGGFISAHWDGTEETETKIKEETKATIRCIPLEVKEESGICVFSGNPSKRRVLFAKAY
jgi:prolyl-tRNA synthetase